jgi:hypothetical protein
MALFEWIEGWYDPHRRHSGLGRRSPMDYERAYERSVASTSRASAAFGGRLDEVPETESE